MEARATMTVGHLERTVEAPASPQPVATRMAQIDALRVLSCFSVIAINALGAPYPPDAVGLGVTSFLLHYSREIFFVVSALVLVRTYYPRLGPDGRLPDPGAFRWRRLKLIGIPYLWWTAIYYALSLFHARNQQAWGQVLGDLPLRWVYLVVTGNGDYHMYFMLVTLEYALAFPLVLRLLKRAEGHHGWVLAGSLVLQVATLYVYQWVYLPDDGWRGIVGDASLPAYQFWLVLGAVAGLHVERCHAWLVGHWRLVAGMLPVAVGVLLGTYFLELRGRDALGASSPLQPVIIVYALAMLGVLYLVAVRIMQRGSARVRAAFSYLAQLSFGVYLAHPMVLDMVLAVLRRIGVLAPSIPVAVLSLALTTGFTVAPCAALHRTRLSLSLMGRKSLEAGTPSPLGVRSGAVSLRRRLLTLPTAVLAASVVGVLFIGSDQSSPAESGTPSGVQVVEASQPILLPDPDDATDVFACGDEQSAPHNCPLDGVHRPVTDEDADEANTAG